MNPKEVQILIEHYLEGKLPLEQLEAFEQKLLSDEDFAKEVKLQEEIAMAIGEADVFELSHKIKKIQSDKNNRKPSKKRFVSFRLAIAAGLALLIGTYFVFNMVNTPASPPELAVQYFSPKSEIKHFKLEIRAVENTKAITEEQIIAINSIWEQIGLLYQKKSYQESLQKIEQIRQMDPDFEIQSPNELYFYRGFLYYLTNQFELTIKDFEKIDADFTEDATWFSALAYLHLGQIEKSKTELKKIIDVNIHPHKKEALRLVKDLEQFK